MTIVAGPLLAEADWDTIRQLGDGVPGLTLLRAVHSMQTLLASAGRVVSQCGYNSALEILQSGCPALFVPFARGQENEQTVRARRFAALRLADWAREEGLDGTELAGRLLAIAPANTATMLNMDGASASARIVAEMAS